MELRKLKTLVLALGAGALLTFGASAFAVPLNSGLTAGVLNTIEDQDREAYFDIDGSGTLSIGDVFVGFVRVDDFGPSGLGSGNHVYGVISNQIIGYNEANPNELYLGATTFDGLRLEQITGDVNTTGGMFAIYDRDTPYAINLINAPTGVSMEDNVDYIVNNGTLRLVAGIVNADDYLQVINAAAYGIGSSNAAYSILPTSVTVGNFVGGFTFLYNNTKFQYAETVVVADQVTGALTTHQFVVGGGAIRGAFGATDAAIFTNAGYDFPQCSVPNGLVSPTEGSGACGFTTDADFFVAPYRVPEPATLALLGIALVGLGGFTRKARAA